MRKRNVSKEKRDLPQRHSRPAAKPPAAIELASVYLELKSYVEPTWDGADPDGYFVSLDGSIFVRSDQDDDDVRVGSVRGYCVRLGQAMDDDVTWWDVIDAHSRDMALYLALIHPDEPSYTDWVRSKFEVFGHDLLILDRIRIEPEHRGHGYGLYGAELMIRGFGFGCSLVACIPARYELIAKEKPESIQKAARTGPEERIPEWKPAQAKLRSHWSLLGFEQVPDSDVFALSLALRRPSIERVMDRYFARKRQGSEQAQRRGRKKRG